MQKVLFGFLFSLSAFGHQQVRCIEIAKNPREVLLKLDEEFPTRFSTQMVVVVNDHPLNMKVLDVAQKPTIRVAGRAYLGGLEAYIELPRTIRGRTVAEFPAVGRIGGPTRFICSSRVVPD